MISPLSPTVSLALALASAAALATLFLFLRRAPAAKRVDLCAADALPVGALREFDVVGPDGVKGKVLLARTGRARFRATSAKCTHYNLPLAGGVLCGDRVVCPWHGAAFNVDTGDIEDGPGLAPLATYAVTLAGGRVLVDVPPAPPARAFANTGACAPPARDAPRDARHFVIIGAGAAGLAAAETLREEGFGGAVTLLNAEPGLPYDRTKLSKNLSRTAAECAVRPREWFTAARITLREATTVAAVRTAEKKVVLVGGEEVAYDALLVATGGPARTFRADRNEGFALEGAELPGVCVLRTGADAADISARADDAIAANKPIVIVGSSFIGAAAGRSARRTALCCANRRPRRNPFTLPHHRHGGGGGPRQPSGRDGRDRRRHGGGAV